MVSELAPLSPNEKKISSVKFGSAIKVGIQLKVNWLIKALHRLNIKYCHLSKIKFEYQY